MHQHVSVPPPHLGDRRPGIDPALEALVGEMLSKPPQARPGWLRRSAPETTTPTTNRRTTAASVQGALSDLRAAVRAVSSSGQIEDKKAEELGKRVDELAKRFAEKGREDAGKHVEELDKYLHERASGGSPILCKRLWNS